MNAPGCTRIESANFDAWVDRPAADYHNLQWLATGERLTKESFLRYRKQGGNVITFTNTEDMIEYGVHNPLPMIASDGSVSRPAPATRGRLERSRAFWGLCSGEEAAVPGRRHPQDDANARPTAGSPGARHEEEGADSARSRRGPHGFRCGHGQGPVHVRERQSPIGGNS